MRLLNSFRKTKAPAQDPVAGPAPPPPARPMPIRVQKVGRNASCRCGSGEKSKDYCLV